MKCVTSPNDFTTDSFQGIPDEYDGRVLTKKHTYTGSIPTLSATNDTYIVLLPIPGYAYFYGSRTAGSVSALTLTGVLYGDTSTVFPSGAENTVVDQFRYASNVIEIVPTVNSMTWTGAIEIWKTPVSGGLTNLNAAGVNEFEINGLEAIDSTRPLSVMPFNHGVYAITGCVEPTCPFKQVYLASAITNVQARMTTNSITFASSANFTGLGDQEAVIIKIPGGTGVPSNTALLRTWACVEYQVGMSSALYEYAHMSAPYDKVALELTKRFIQEHACGVPFYENANFWQNVWSWVKEISGALKVVPGPVGHAAEIANLVSTTAEMYI